MVFLCGVSASLLCLTVPLDARKMDVYVFLVVGGIFERKGDENYPVEYRRSANIGVVTASLQTHTHDTPMTEERK